MGIVYALESLIWNVRKGICDQQVFKKKLMSDEILTLRVSLLIDGQQMQVSMPYPADLQSPQIIFQPQPSGWSTFFLLYTYRFVPQIPNPTVQISGRVDQSRNIPRRRHIKIWSAI